jgi:RNA polymerase sigma-70 factor (sigma-E family)
MQRGKRDTTGLDGFEPFVRANYAALVRFGILVVGDRGRAEDLVQEALARSYRRWPHLEDPSRADAYVRTVMIRLSRRWRARRWQGERPTAGGSLPEPRPGASGVAGDATGRVDLVEALAGALATLTPDQRAVLVLRYFEERSETEIASILGCSAGTVKSRAARGLAALRTSGLLDDEPGGIAWVVAATDRDEPPTERGDDAHA